MTGKPRKDLTLERVVDAALGQAGTGGIAAVTIRGVATELNVTPMAIYWHVANRNALLDAIGDRVCAEIDLPSVANDAHWPDRYLADLRNFVRVLGRHPGAAPVVPARMPYHPGSLRVLEQRIALLRDAGLNELDAARSAWQATRLAIELVTDPMYGQRADTGRREHIRDSYRDFARAAGKEHPGVRAIELLITADDHEEYVDLGLRTFVAGLAGGNGEPYCTG